MSLVIFDKNCMNSLFIFDVFYNMTFKLQPHEIHSAVWLRRLIKFNCLCNADRSAGKWMNLCLNLVENESDTKVHSVNLTKWLLFLRKWCKKNKRKQSCNYWESKSLANMSRILNYQVRRQECPALWRTKRISLWTRSRKV